MATQVQRRRGTASEHNTFTGAAGEVTVNTTNDSLHVHDGATAGGIELSRADGQNANMATSAMPAGSVIQVLTFQDSSVVTTSSTSFQDTNLSGSITPQFSNSQILVVCQTSFRNITNSTNGSYSEGRVVRNGVEVGERVAYGTRENTGTSTGDHVQGAGSIMVLDSPATTSSVTYKIQLATNNTGHNARFNDPDNATSGSTMTLMEIKG